MSDAWLEFRWLVYEPLIASRPFDDRPFDERVLGQVGPLGTRCAQCVAKVILLVGRDKSGSAGMAAADVDEKISRLKDSVLDTRKSWSTKLGEKIEGEIKAAERAHEMFGKASSSGGPTKVLIRRCLCGEVFFNQAPVRTVTEAHLRPLSRELCLETRPPKKPALPGTGDSPVIGIAETRGAWSMVVAAVALVSQ
jgi:hypothetical protein